MVLPAIPASMKDYTSVSEAGDVITATFHSGGNDHERKDFINALLQQAGIDTSKRVFFSGGDWPAIETYIGETLGNLSQHMYHIARPSSYVSLSIDKARGSCTIKTIGFVDPINRKRMDIKFQAAAALTSEEAIQRLNAIDEGNEYDGVTTAMGHVTGGMGMLTQRALGEGHMKLTFYPDRTLITHDDDKQPLTLQQFEFSHQIIKGKEHIVTSANHHGPVRSFFPHVVRE